MNAIEYLALHSELILWIIVMIHLAKHAWDYLQKKVEDESWKEDV